MHKPPSAQRGKVAQEAAPGPWPWRIQVRPRSTGWEISIVLVPVLIAEPTIRHSCIECAGRSTCKGFLLFNAMTPAVHAALIIKDYHCTATLLWPPRLAGNPKQHVWRSSGRGRRSPRPESDIPIRSASYYNSLQGSEAASCICQFHLHLCHVFCLEGLSVSVDSAIGPQTLPTLCNRVQAHWIRVHVPL